MCGRKQIIVSDIDLEFNSDLGHVQVRQEPTTASEQIGEVLPGETYVFDEIGEKALVSH